MGWEEEPFHGTTLLYHGGTTGHAAGVFLLPEKNLGIVILLGAYSHFAKEHIGRGLAAIALGAAPAADGQGELASLLGRERGVMVLLAVCPATLVLPPLVRRRERAPWGRRRRVARAAALVAVAAAAWIAAFHLSLFIPELPLPFGLHGYVPQLVIIVAAVLCTVTAWAVWALLRIRID